MHHPAKALLAIFIAANVAAQERDASPTGLSAKLLSTKQWSMQCDPIRFTLRLRSDRNDVRVRITPHKAHAAICKANPFFAYWWRHEARYLLLQ